MSQPLILTLLLNEAAQAFYEGLRIRYFPSERNLVPAHLTLFHQLPDSELTHQTVQKQAHKRSVFQLTRPSKRSIGRGVAVFFQSDQLATLHADLSIAFELNLTLQDRQPFRPHIVVQNKVDSETARQTLEQLQTEPLIEPDVTGLTLWRYMGGPWQYLRHFYFAAS